MGAARRYSRYVPTGELKIPSPSYAPPILQIIESCCFQYGFRTGSVLTRNSLLRLMTERRAENDARQWWDPARPAPPSWFALACWPNEMKETVFSVSPHDSPTIGSSVHQPSWLRLQPPIYTPCTGCHKEPGADADLLTSTCQTLAQLLVIWPTSL